PHVQLAAMAALSPLGSQAEAAVAKLEKLLHDNQKSNDNEATGKTIAKANEKADPKAQPTAGANDPLSDDDTFQACGLATLVSLAPERDDLVARLVRLYPKHAIYEQAYDEVSRCLARSAEPGLLKAVKVADAEVRAATLATMGTAIRAGRFPTSASALQVFGE